MSFEDLEEARVKRAAKEKATTDKSKHGRKRKSPAPETDSPESETGSPPEPKAKVARMSEVPEPWRVPVARMY